jgi:aspartyl-tRNA(Asn)/glutamyl-tRNA(Gln) amidotransferase subunit A
MPTRRVVVQAGLAASALLGAGGGQAAEPASAAALPDLDLLAAADALRRRSVSPVELVEACLARIAALDPSLNAFVTVTGEQALARARECEAELARGRSRGALHGIPIALKDNIDTAGIRTTAAAAAFTARVPEANAEVARRLEEAGAILLGKLNMDECAYGVSSTTGHFGAVANPWAPERIAGGSSGGPAAAVAARLCYGALGTDTGGSIRQPAAYCGIVGFKPTHGLVSTRGVVPLSWSLDHVGPMCRTVADAAVLLQAIAGYDAADPHSIAAPPAEYLRATAEGTRRLRLGRPAGFWFEELDADVAAAIDAALARLGELTAGVTHVELPPVPSLSILFVEASAYLGDAVKKAPDGFSPATRALVEMGAKISATSYAEAQRKLALARRATQSIFESVDLLVAPTTPDLPMTIDEARTVQPRRGPPLSARNTTPFNIYGLPTISIPCGFSRTGLPVGLQIAGPPLGEARVLALGAAYQRRTDWHRRAPPGLA